MKTRIHALYALTLAALLALLLVNSGCAVFGGRSRDWYNGPSEYKEATRNAINISIAELSAELGRPLKFRWDKDQITVNVPPPDGHVHGIPAVRNPHHGGLVWGYAAGRRAVVPAGHRPSALVHEVGHVVMHVNGMQSIDPETHHRMAPRFFRKHNGR